MKELFDKDGHLTDYALMALINNEIDEISRLEIAEHLSFCDECILRYTELLSDDILLSPKESCVPTVMQKIKKTAAIIFFNKYVTMTIAASIAMTLWITGVFTSFDNNNLDKFTTSIETASEKISETTENISYGIEESISHAFEIFNKERNIYNEKE